MSRSILSDRQVAELFGSLSDQEHYVFLDTSMPDERNRQSLLFTGPVEQLQFRSGDDRAAFLDAVEHRLQRGYWVAGWLGYEFLHDRIGIEHQSGGEQPLLLADVGVYGNAERFVHELRKGTPSESGAFHPGEAGYRLGNLHPTMEEGPYCRAIRKILDYIGAGDTYQVNYTFKLNFDFYGSVQHFYRDLRRNQPVPYGALIRNGSRHTLSLSPELFFRMENGTISARPMKGTMKRGRTGTDDAAIARMLKNDEKNRSENVMIVDLLRNDLSRLVEDNGGGTVKVVSLFDIERYRTVLQMTSSIVAKRFCDESVSPRQIVDAIFPCGSVTGAPKIRTMQIIDELENEPRGVYTGAIGFFSPRGEAVFNVPIRTVVIDGEKGEMGIGSGIVADSSPEDEWRECLLKAKFLTNLVPCYEMIETMLYHPDRGIVFLDDHLRRLTQSAEHLGLSCDGTRIRAALGELSDSLSGDGCRKIRLTMDTDGVVAIEDTPCDPPRALTMDEAIGLVGADPEPLPVVDFASESTDSSSPWLFHKTTRREQYNRLYHEAVNAGLADVLFCNERGELTEGGVSNIVVECDGSYYTPPVSCGLLPGVMRANLLKNDSSVPVTERVLSRDDVRRAGSLFICNGVRGLSR